MKKLSLKEISALSDDELNLLIMYYISDKGGDCNKPFVREDGSPDFDWLSLHFYSKRLANLADPTQYPYEYYRKGVQYAAKDWANSLDALIELAEALRMDDTRIQALAFTREATKEYKFAFTKEASKECKKGIEPKKWNFSIWSDGRDGYYYCDHEGQTKRVGAEALLFILQGKVIKEIKKEKTTEELKAELKQKTEALRIKSDRLKQMEKDIRLLQLELQEARNSTRDLIGSIGFTLEGKVNE